MTGAAHVKAALEFTVTAQLHEDNLIQRQADQVQRLRDGCAGILSVCHGAWWAMMQLSTNQSVPPREIRIGELCPLPDWD